LIFKIKKKLFSYNKIMDEDHCEGFKCLMNKYGKTVAVGAGIAGLLGGALLLPEAVGAMGAIELLQLVSGSTEGIALAGVETVIAGI